MRTYTSRILAIAAVAPCVIVGCSYPAVAESAALAVARSARPRSVAIAQAARAPKTADAAPAKEPIGLPRVREYEAVPELRDIYFDYGKAVIRAADIKTLDANVAWLRAHPDHVVLIEGHCDNRGDTDKKNELNVDLGERRAQAAMNYFVTQGIHPGRITILSYGEERPQCIEASEACWRHNRRSRFLVKPR